jgi:hypothetical protein
VDQTNSSINSTEQAVFWSPTLNVTGYTQFTDYSNPLYVSAQNALYHYYPYLKSYLLYQVQYQIVKNSGGDNFKFYINDTSSGNYFAAFVNVNLQGTAIVE